MGTAGMAVRHVSTITDPMSGLTSAVKSCKVCSQPIYFGFTEKGKRCPFDVVDGNPTRTSHFTTCSQVARFRAMTEVEKSR